MPKPTERPLQGSEYALLSIFLCLFGYGVWIWLTHDGPTVYGIGSAAFVLGILFTMIRGRTSMFAPPEDSGFRRTPTDKDPSA